MWLRFAHYARARRGEEDRIMTHYFSLFNFLMANWNWAVFLVAFVVFGWLAGR